MPDRSGVILLVKLAEPVPSDDLAPAIVGVGDVDQHTPFSVIVAPPSDEILPPEDADVSVIDVTATVPRVGAEATDVVNAISLPYEVPAEFVA